MTYLNKQDMTKCTAMHCLVRKSCARCTSLYARSTAPISEQTWYSDFSSGMPIGKWIRKPSQCKYYISCKQMEPKGAEDEVATRVI